MVPEGLFSSPALRSRSVVGRRTGDEDAGVRCVDRVRIPHLNTFLGSLVVVVAVLAELPFCFLWERSRTHAFASLHLDK